MSSLSIYSEVSKLTNEKIIWDFLKSQGLSDCGTAGLMGNLYAESALKSTNLQQTYEKTLGMTDDKYTAAVDNGTYTNFIKDKAGYGLAQWTYWSRKENLYNFAKEKNSSIGDLQMQLEFLWWELSNNYKSLTKLLSTTSSIQEASNEVLFKFERPANQNESVQAKRAAYGQKYYDKYAIKKEVKKMKYSASNQPLVCMQTQSTCYKGTTTMEVKGVLWHSTGANNPTLKRYVQPSDNALDKEKMLELLGVNKYKNDWNHIERQAGLNCWIGKLADGTVTTVQTMPWNYKPWGCGSGSKGSCNSGWIQFEICEDALTDEQYFNAVYQEACEITAYLCQMFNIDPKGTVNHNGVTVPTILCHQDAYKLKLGSNHGDVLHWFPKHGKTMDDVRNDVAALLATAEPEVKEEEEVTPPAAVENSFKVGDVVKIKDGATYYSGKTIPSWVMKQEWIVSAVSDKRVVINKSTSSQSAINSPVHADNLILVERKETVVTKYYRVRKSWDDSKSQIGAYLKEENAIDACKKAGAGYSVYDDNGKVLFTVPVEDKIEEDDTTLKVGSEVKLVPGSKYASGATIPNWVFGRKLYLRSIHKNGNYVISTLKTGAVTGTVKPESVVAYSTTLTTPGFAPYVVRITASALNVRSGPSTKYKINTTVKKNELYTIIAETDGWGRLKSGAGWICLNGYTKKV